MSLMKMYVADSTYFNAEQINEKIFIIHLSNGKEIRVEKEPEHNGSIWGWKVDNQVFDREDYALSYLKKLVAEKLTGKRIIHHRKMEVPVICGVNGAACRSPGKCNLALCWGCPVAEKYFADRDGVELVYAVSD